MLVLNHKNLDLFLKLGKSDDLNEQLRCQVLSKETRPVLLFSILKLIFLFDYFDPEKISIR